MNRTAAALALLLGSLAPIPSAQALDPCVPVDDGSVADELLETGAHLETLAQAANPCLPEDTCTWVGEHCPLRCPDGEVPFKDGCHAPRDVVQDCRTGACVGDPCEDSACPQPDSCDVLECDPETPRDREPASCSRSEDDPGFGGTHVTCYYSCRELDAIVLTVSAEDADADVTGHTDCGGASAKCPRQPYACVAPAAGLAQHDQPRQGCVGDSHEAFSSAVTVACYTLGSKETLCAILDCDLAARPSFAELCAAQNPDADAEALASLLGHVPDVPEVGSFVVAWAKGATGRALHYAGGADPSCRFESW